MLKDGQKSNRHEILHNIDEMTKAKGKDGRQFAVGVLQKIRLLEYKVLS